LKAKPRRTAKRAADPVKPLLQLIEKTLDDGKAEEMTVIDLHGKSSIADYLVIASGRSHRQVAALAERLVGALHQAGHKRAATEGLPFGDWVLVDAGDVVVHLFRPESRLHYNLEKMWGEDFTEAEAEG
jgi:ribosome-associated protein